VHAVLGDAPARLVPLRDLAQMMQSVELDSELVMRLCCSWKVEGVVARAVCTARSVFQLREESPVSVWAHRYQLSRSERRMLQRYPKTADNYAAVALAELLNVPSIRAKASYLRAMLLPDQGYLDDRSVRRLGRWRRGARSLLDWRADR
jgi:hypothetical protein